MLARATPPPKLASLARGSLDITAHEYLKSLYQDPNQSPSLRLRAAIKAIEVETPKVSAVAIAAFDGQTFAEALERCIERSKGPPMLNGTPRQRAKEPICQIELQEVLKKPPPLLRAA